MIYRAPERERENLKGQNRQSLVGGAMVLTAAMVAAKIIGALYRMPLNLIFGGHGLGIYYQAYEFYATVYSVAVIGFPVAVSRIVAGYAREGRFRDIRKTVRVANLFFLALGVAGTLVLILFARFYAESILKNANVYISILAVAPSVLFSCMMSTYRGYNQGMKNMTPTAVSQVVEVVVKVAVGLVSAYWIKAALTREYETLGSVLGAVAAPEDAEMMILSYVAAGAIFGVTVSTFAGWLFLRIRQAAKGDGITDRQIEESPAAETQGRLLRRILAVGIPVALGSVTATFTQLIDSIMIQNRLISVLQTDPYALVMSHGAVSAPWGMDVLVRGVDPGYTATFLFGCYTLGFSFFNLVPAVTGSFGMSALPHVTDSWIGGDKNATRIHIESTLKITMLIAAPAGFGIASLAEPILHLFFSRTEQEVSIGGPILAVLGIAAIGLALTGPINSILQAVGRLDVPIKMLVAGGSVKVAVNYILVGMPSVNIGGAPIGSLLCYALVAVGSTVWLIKHTGLKLDIMGTIVKPMLSGALCGLSAWLCYFLQMRYLSEYIRPKVATLIAVALAIAVYGISLALFRAVAKTELQTLFGGGKIAKLLEKLHIVR